MGGKVAQEKILGPGDKSTISNVWHIFEIESERAQSELPGFDEYLKRRRVLKRRSTTKRASFRPKFK
jgi:hypothetical protein